MEEMSKREESEQISRKKKHEEGKNLKTYIFNREEEIKNNEGMVSTGNVSFIKRASKIPRRTEESMEACDWISIDTNIERSKECKIVLDLWC